MTSLPSTGQRGRAPVGLLVGLLMLASASPAAVGFREGPVPLVFERTGDEGDAWAVAVRSHDEPTSSQGNEVRAVIRVNAPYERSVAGMGIVELAPDDDGRLRTASGFVGAVFRGEDTVHVEPLGEIQDPTAPDLVASQAPSDEGGSLAFMAERRFMDPGEWRYFVVWAAGSETSTFQLRGKGFTVEKVVPGEGHALGNDELVNGGGVHAHQSLTLPPGTSHRDDGQLGAGVSAVSGTGATIETNAPMLGVFTEFQSWKSCVGSCMGFGWALDYGAGLVEEGGLADLALETPREGHVWNEHGLYWLMPQTAGEAWHNATMPGSYRFLVEHLRDVSGPEYQDPIAAQGARLNGEQLVVSVGVADYTQLEGLSDSGG